MVCFIGNGGLNEKLMHLSETKDSVVHLSPVIQQSYGWNGKVCCCGVVLQYEIVVLENLCR